MADDITTFSDDVMEKLEAIVPPSQRQQLRDLLVTYLEMQINGSSEHEYTLYEPIEAQMLSSIRAPIDMTSCVGPLHALKSQYQASGTMVDESALALACKLLQYPGAHFFEAGSISCPTDAVRAPRVREVLLRMEASFWELFPEAHVPEVARLCFQSLLRHSTSRLHEKMILMVRAHPSPATQNVYDNTIASLETMTDDMTRSALELQRMCLIWMLNHPFAQH